MAVELAQSVTAGADKVAANNRAGRVLESTSLSGAFIRLVEGMNKFVARNIERDPSRIAFTATGHGQDNVAERFRTGTTIEAQIEKQIENKRKERLENNPALASQLVQDPENGPTTGEEETFFGSLVHVLEWAQAHEDVRPAYTAGAPLTHNGGEDRWRTQTQDLLAHFAPYAQSVRDSRSHADKFASVLPNAQPDPEAIARESAVLDDHDLAVSLLYQPGVNVLGEGERLQPYIRLASGVPMGSVELLDAANSDGRPNAVLPSENAVS